MSYNVLLFSRIQATGAHLEKDDLDDIAHISTPGGLVPEGLRQPTFLGIARTYDGKIVPYSEIKRVPDGVEPQDITGVKSNFPDARIMGVADSSRPYIIMLHGQVQKGMEPYAQEAQKVYNETLASLGTVYRPQNNGPKGPQ